MKLTRQIGYHLLAVITASIWGTTFVSTKMLLDASLSPVEIFCYRFVVAYLCIWPFAYKRLWADSLRDELLLILLGITGGSVYFLAENTALEWSRASNVSLLVCTAPIFTTLLMSLFSHEKIQRKLIYGSLVALVGVALVVFGPSQGIRISLRGDGLALAASVLWAVYSITLKALDGHYANLFLTRKIFFYGLISMGVWLVLFPEDFHWPLLTEPKVYLNILFLGVVASMLCYLTWNAIIRVLGASRTTNYLYFNPLVACIASAFVLGEEMTTMSIFGSILIVVGVYIAVAPHHLKRG